MLKESTKSSIIKYILLKIQSRDWKPYSKIPSSQAIANKFFCHINTSKSALTQLVSSDVLYTENGKGFYVNPHSSFLFSSFRTKHLVEDVRYVKLSKSEEKWLSKNYSMSIDKRAIKKEYYKDGKKIAIIYSFMYHFLFDHYSEYPIKQETSFPIFLSNMGIIVGGIERAVKMTQDDYIIQKIKTKNNVVICKKTNIFDTDKKLIEKSISFIVPEFFQETSIFKVS